MLESLRKLLEEEPVPTALVLIVVVQGLVEIVQIICEAIGR